MRTIQDLRRDEKDAQSLRSRSGVIFFFLLILIIAGVFKILQLTVLDRVSYAAESDKNRIINIPIYPARGLIKLEDGTLIAKVKQCNPGDYENIMQTSSEVFKKWRIEPAP